MAFAEAMLAFNDASAEAFGVKPISPFMRDGMPKDETYAKIM